METGKIAAGTSFYIRELEKAKGRIAELEPRLAAAEAVIQKLSALELQRGRYLGTNGMGHEMHDAPYFKVSEINTLIAEADKFLGLDDDE